MHAVDVHRYAISNSDAFTYHPLNAVDTHNISSDGADLPTPHGRNIVSSSLSAVQAELAYTKRILKKSENHRKEVCRWGKELVDQVNTLLVELHAERQKSANLQVQCTCDQHLKREAETQLEHALVKCANLSKELEKEKEVNANLGSEVNALYEQHQSSWEMAAVSTARNKELEAMLAGLYGTPEERIERAKRAEEEREAKLALQRDLISETAARKSVEDENKTLRTAVHSLQKQLQGVTFFTKPEDEEFKPQPKGLFIKEEEDY